MDEIWKLTVEQYRRLLKKEPKRSPPSQPRNMNEVKHEKEAKAAEESRIAEEARAADAVVQKEVVGHADTVGLHRMTLSVVEVAHVGVVKVRDLRLPAHGAMLRLMLCLPRRNEEDGPR